MNAQNINNGVPPLFNTGPTNLTPTTAQSIGNAFGLNNSVQQDFNSNMMNKANSFNQFMSDSAYQRTTADMIKAGINPVVAFGLGRGQLDSSPTSAVASSSSNSGTFGKLLTSLISSISNIAKGFF